VRAACFLSEYPRILEFGSQRCYSLLPQFPFLPSVFLVFARIIGGFCRFVFFARFLPFGCSGLCVLCRSMGLFWVVYELRPCYRCSVAACKESYFLAAPAGPFYRIGLLVLRPLQAGPPFPSSVSSGRLMFFFSGALLAVETFRTISNLEIPPFRRLVLVFSDLYSLSSSRSFTFGGLC